jgi:hypothetical protein
LLPGANLARVSRVQVQILQPRPPSLVVAQDETVAVVAEISGAEVDQVILETWTADAPARRQPMRAQAADRYAANVQVGSQSVRYRILAGDAVTRKYTLHARPRPAVLAFDKTYQFPAYSGLAPRNVREAGGDLVALAGTQVRLDLHLNQPVIAAELRLQTGGAEQVEVVRLQRREPRRWSGTLQLTEEGIYKVHLVGRETGFENPFSPQYELRALPDLVPRVGFVGQQDTTLLLPPNDILQLEALAEDDLPLVSLEQQISINGAAWTSRPLDIQPRRRVTVSWQWDLLDLKLKPGDRLTTRLAARDRQGNVGQSIPLQLVIATADLDPDRHATMERKTVLLQQLLQLAELVQRQQEGVGLPAAKQSKPSSLPPLDESTKAALLELTGQLAEQAAPVRDQVVQTLPQIARGADGHDVEAVGQALVRLVRQQIPQLHAALDLWEGAADAEQRKSARQRLHEVTAECTKQVIGLAEDFRLSTAHTILAGLALDLQAVREHQRRVLASPAADSWERMLRQQNVTLAHLRELERRIRDNQAYLPQWMHSHMLQTLDLLDSARQQIQQASETEDQLPRLRRAAELVEQRLVHLQGRLPIQGRLPRDLGKARQRLVDRAGLLHPLIEQLAEATARRDRLNRAAGQAEDSTESQRWQRQLEQLTAELQQRMLPPLASFTDRRDLARARRDSDPRRASDLGLTARALSALLAAPPDQLPPAPDGSADQQQKPTVFDQLAEAFQTLQAGHQVLQLHIALHDLVLFEQWESQSLAARIQTPAQWDLLQASLGGAAGQLRTAGYAGELCSQLDGLRSAEPLVRAGHKIAARRLPDQGPVSAAHDLRQLQEQLEEVVEQIEPVMAEARALIAQLIPSVAELASHAARQVRQLQEHTNQLADEISVSDQTADQAKKQQLQQQQRTVNDQLQALSEALVEDANAQDLLDTEQRERARDADASLALLQQSSSRMNRDLQQVVQSERPGQQAGELAQAAESQHDVAQTLQQIAGHYRQLESGADPAATRAALRQSEQKAGIARQMEQRYGEAEQLGEMADGDPRQLLAELESQLAEQPAMREALSDIARDVLQEAKHALEYAAAQQRQMRQQLEQSDSDFAARKKELVRQVREIARHASAANRTLVASAENAAARGKSDAAREKLNQASSKLQQAVQQAEQATEQKPLDSVVQRVAQAAAALQQAAEQLAESQGPARAAKRQEIHDKGRQRENERKQMEAQQRRVQQQRVGEAKDWVRHRRQQQQQAEQTVGFAERRQRDADQQLKRAQQALNRDPDSQSAQAQKQQAQVKQREAHAALTAARQAQSEAQQRLEQAQQAVQEIQQRKLQPLEAVNPAAELAERLAGEAHQDIAQLARQARQLTGRPDWADRLQPSAAALQRAADQQRAVKQDVARIAEDVSRAGRHEQRLGQADNSQQLQQAAEAIERVGEEEVADAQQKLERAGDEPPEADSQPSRSGQLGRQAHQSVATARQAILQQAAGLEAILQGPSAEGQTSAADTSSASPAGQASSAAASAEPISASQRAEGQRLARLLDEVDQALAAGAQQAASAARSGMAAPWSLSQEARNQSARLAQSRQSLNSSQQGPPSLDTALQSGPGADVRNMAELERSLPTVDRSELGDWGRLRKQSAEDVTEAAREGIPAEYRQQVETYFRVIAERARQRQQAPASSPKK